MDDINLKTVFFLKNAMRLLDKFYYKILVSTLFVNTKKIYTKKHAPIVSILLIIINRICVPIAENVFKKVLMIIDCNL